VDELRGNKNSKSSSYEMNVEGIRGRPKKKWLDTIENDMRDVCVFIGDVEN